MINNTEDLGRCDKSCIGGCTGQTQLDCYACRNVMDLMSDGRKHCIKSCPVSLLKVRFYLNIILKQYIDLISLQYENWRCISQAKCSEKKTRFNAETIGMEKSYKNYQGKCLEHCPPDTEEVNSTCKKCVDCAIECPGEIIRSLETLRKFEGCTKIIGNLAIQISGSKFQFDVKKFTF